MREFDILVVGGGINGAGIARDAAGRGARVALVEQNDLASGTSSASSKLIHGGLRYLEYGAFGLVRKALQEREILLNLAPHLIWPCCFVMPHVAQQRPAWMLRAGLFLYDHLAGANSLPQSRQIALRQHEAGVGLAAEWTRAFVYADACADDARLVLVNAQDAARRGAQVWTRHRVVRVSARNGGWQVEMIAADGMPRTCHARALVHAGGPWLNMPIPGLGAAAEAAPLQLVQGSHIVVPRLFAHDLAYVLPHTDGRIVFVLPYRQAYTLIGTTERPFHGDPSTVQASAEEVAYLCALCSRYFVRPLRPEDVRWSFAGVRPLVDAHAQGRRATALSRDYHLQLDTPGAPVLKVLGGKLTTYRRLAEEAVTMLAPLLSLPRAGWTAQAPLPGAELSGQGPLAARWQAYCEAARQEYAWLEPALLTRYLAAYGTALPELLSGCQRPDDLGMQWVPGLHQRELDYLMQHEWAETAEDVLWRRSKLGLGCKPDDVVRLEAGMRSRRLERGASS